MALDRLPSELLQEVGNYLDIEADLNALVRTSKAFYSVLNTALYAHNVRRFESGLMPWSSVALLWAIQPGRPERTYNLALQAKKDRVSPGSTKLADDAFEEAIFRGRADLLQYQLANDDCTGTPKHFIVNAAETGNGTVFRTLLESGIFDPHYQDERKRTPLHYASELGHVVIVRILLDINTINPDAKAKGGVTTLYDAAENGHTEVMNMLLATNKVDVNARDMRGFSPLARAIRSNQLEAARILLQADSINPDIGPHHELNPLSSAAANGNMEAVKMLIDGGADVNYVNAGATALGWAASSGHLDIVHFLLNLENVRVNPDPPFLHSPLLMAVSQGQKNVILTLLARDDIDANAMDEKGDTPVTHAIRRSQWGAVDALLSSSKTDVNLIDGNGDTPLWIATEHNEGSIARRLLSAQGIQPDAGGVMKRTPLMVAACLGHIRILKMLLEHDDVRNGSAIQQVDNPFLLASAEKEREAMEILRPYWMRSLELADKQVSSSIG